MAFYSVQWLTLHVEEIDVEMTSSRLGEVTPPRPVESLSLDRDIRMQLQTRPKRNEWGIDDPFLQGTKSTAILCSDANIDWMYCDRRSESRYDASLRNPMTLQDSLVGRQTIGESPAPLRLDVERPLAWFSLFHHHRHRLSPARLCCWPCSSLAVLKALSLELVQAVSERSISIHLTQVILLEFRTHPTRSLSFTIFFRYYYTTLIPLYSHRSVFCDWGRLPKCSHILISGDSRDDGNLDQTCCHCPGLVFIWIWHHSTISRPPGRFPQTSTPSAQKRKL